MATDLPWADKTFADALEWCARRYGEAPAVIHGDRRLSFKELAEQVEAFAAGLVDIGIGSGDKVALWLPDSIEWMIARWAVPIIGAILVPINTRFKDSELAYALSHSDRSALIMQASFRAIRYDDIFVRARGSYHGGLSKLRHVIAVGDEPISGATPFSEISQRGLRRRNHAEELQALRAAVKPHDIAQILYTSGTTSFPKGAMVRHSALLQNNFNSIPRMRLNPSDRFLATAPLFSATGTSYTLYTFLSGGAVVLMDGFSPEEFCRIVEAERVTGAFLIEPMLYDLRRYEGLSRHDLSSLRTGTGTPLTPKSFRWLVDDFGMSDFTNAYGMSETSNAACRSHWYESTDDRVASVGLPLPGVDLAVVDLDNDQPVKPGQIGEIRIRGYTVMAGYYKMERETTEAIDADGWLHTGDLGELRPDGRLMFRGRIKEMIKPGGFNVATLEIEDFIKTFPGVREAALVGVPDERMGEVGYAFVEPEQGAALDIEAIKKYCRDHIASYKIPRQIEVVADWPRTSTGKIMRMELKGLARGRLSPQADS
jgi:fatty-acyl-CoA synthase